MQNFLSFKSEISILGSKNVSKKFRPITIEGFKTGLGGLTFGKRNNRVFIGLTVAGFYVITICDQLKRVHTNSRGESEN